jgi:hypothetical protein
MYTWDMNSHEQAPDLPQELRQLRVAASGRLSDLLAKRAQLDRDIARVQLFLARLQSVPEGTDAEELERLVVGNSGLTEACLKVLTAAYEALTPSQVVSGLRQRRFPVDTYSNPTAVVTTTLKRLEKKKKVLTVTNEDGAICYQWAETAMYAQQFEALLRKALNVPKRS